MVPPFLAYYGADKWNTAIVQESFNQCMLYRQILQPSTGGAWMHIIGPQNQDTGLWSTGNGWAAAGMARVLATFMKSPFAQNVTSHNSSVTYLTQYIKEIVDGAMTSPSSFGLLRNYLNDTTNDGQGFPEISGSSLLASVAYRRRVRRQLHDVGGRHPRGVGRVRREWPPAHHEDGHRDSRGEPDELA